MAKSEIAILIILRIIGIGALFALPAVFFPYDWMNAIHGELGLGTLPDAPIVSYLTRSLSALYFTLGIVTLYVSRDIRQNREMVSMWAKMACVVGVLLTGIAIAAGMPMSWIVSEGPPAVLTGIIVLWLLRISAETPPE